MGKAAPYLQRTMEWARAQGLAVGKTEQWIPRARYRRKSDGVMVTPNAAGVRRDLFGWIDCIAFSQEEGIIGVQATSRAGISAHLAKMRSDDVRPHVLGWLRSGGRAWLVGWKKPKHRWEVYVRELGVEDFEAVGAG